MNFSLNEIEALSKKAARGAGMTWGISEEAGKAVRWLASHNLPGCEALANLLTLNDTPDTQTFPPATLNDVWVAPNAQPLCPLRTGAALNDCAEQLRAQTVEIGLVAYPLLLLPFAAWASVHLARPVCVSWDKVEAASDGYGIDLKDSEGSLSTPQTEKVLFKLAGVNEAKFALPTQRGNVGAKAWEQLDEFAHRTYAPATEASRLLGAGAGVSDND